MGTATSIRIRCAALAAAGVLLLAGCGSAGGSTGGAPLALPGLSGVTLPQVGGTTEGGGGSGGGGGGGGNTTPAPGLAGALGGLAGFNSACLSVAGAYASITLSLLTQLGTGSGNGQTGTFDPGALSKAISSLGGNVPAELQGDVNTLVQAANSASGKTLEEAGKIFDDPAVKKATDDMDAWMTKNCGS